MPNNTQVRGIRKASERIMMPNRTLVITEPDASKLDWESIPDGTLMVDPATGHTFAKVIGQSDWIPTNIKNDGTVSIARDNIIIEEIFTIKDPGPDTEGNFTYYNTDGQERRMPRLGNGGFVFELERGSYLNNRNLLEAYVDDLLHRTSTSGGLQELSETKFAIFDKLEEGQEITARYSKIVRIGNPYPRIFMGNIEPDAAEIGDLWIDINEQIDKDASWEIVKDDELDGSIKCYSLTMAANQSISFATNNSLANSVRVIYRDASDNWTDAYNKVRIVYNDKNIKLINVSGEVLNIKAVIQTFNEYSSRDIELESGKITRLTIDNAFASDTRILTLDENQMSETYGSYIMHHCDDIITTFYTDGIAIYNSTMANIKIRVVSQQIKDVKVSNLTIRSNAVANVGITNQYKQNVKVYVIDDTLNSRTGNDYTTPLNVCTITYSDGSIAIKNITDKDLIVKVVYGHDDVIEVS